MAGGFSSESLNQALQEQAASQGQGEGYAPQAPVMSADDYYRTMTQPTSLNDTVQQAYQQTLGRAPDEAGRNYWGTQAQNLGWTGQELAKNIQAAGAAERGVSGFQSQYDPNAYLTQALNRPSYYNTNPYAVDYQNIFNPQAGSVLRANPTMTPAQQAQYLTGWQQNYQSGVQRGLDQTKADRIAKADAAMKTYQETKAKEEANKTSKEDTQRMIDEALASYIPPNNNNNIYFGGKAGGSVPGGLRSLRGLTKP